MEKKNTLLRYAGIRDDGYRDYLEVVLLGNMTDALTERMRKAISAKSVSGALRIHTSCFPEASSRCRTPTESFEQNSLSLKKGVACGRLLFSFCISRKKH